MIELVAFQEHRAALAFSDYLKTIGIDNSIDVEPNRFALILHDEQLLTRARQELEIFLQNPQNARYWQSSWQTGQIIQQPLDQHSMGITEVIKNLWARAGILTLLISILCIFTYVLFAADPKAIFAALSYPLNPKHSIEYWRFLTPIFLHFSLMHLIFNLIWWWDLAGLIERTQSKMQLLGVFLATALLSNFGQSLALENANNFGGLSGVVYGLLGYVWLYPLANPKVEFRLNPAIIIFMIVWLTIGYSGILDNIIGKMANEAHLIGLLTGVILGCAFGMLHRLTRV